MFALALGRAVDLVAAARTFTHAVADGSATTAALEWIVCKPERILAKSKVLQRGVDVHIGRTSPHQGLEELAELRASVVLEDVEPELAAPRGARDGARDRDKPSAQRALLCNLDVRLRTC